MPARRAELLDDIVSQTEVVLSEFGMTGDVLQHLGHALADHLADHWGGQVVSFPKDSSYKLSQREQEILAAHRAGTPIAVLSRQYKMGERGLRKLLKRAARRDPNHNQPQLF
jgi:Mor family transcriptional regulator